MIEQLVLVAEPVARHNDPATSHLAAKAVARGSVPLEARIAETVCASHVPLTAEQIAHQITLETDRWGHGTIETAVTRARRRGWIHPAGTGLTSRQREATTYRGTP